MNTPFVFGKLAVLENFTNREKETELLISNFKSLINTIIISPRRWGKSSLVAKVADVVTKKNKKIRVCQIDLFNIRNEEQFYTTLALSVLKATSSKWEENIEYVKKFFSRLVPKIVLMGDATNEISLSFDWKDLRENPDEILDLAEKIAADKKIKLIICIDEFQNISGFSDPESFQKKLRSHWQKHQNVAYCLYGSKRHMMLDVFTNTSMPFYKFGTILFLEKISTDSWIKFMIERFSATKKSISKKNAELISYLADNHPYYVQQLAQQVWLRTKYKVTEIIVREAHTSIVEQLSLLFVTMTESLTTKQINFLKALVGGETALYSSKVLSKYDIGTSANVTRIKKSLIEKDILDDKAGELSFQDPMYKYWLENYYFLK